MKRKVYVLGAHPLHGYSMRRYTELLAQTYKDLGFDVQVVRPTSRFSTSCNSGRLRKLVIYVEKLILFPLTLPRMAKDSHVHIADHSDGVWLLYPPLHHRDTTITCHDLFAIRAAMGDIQEHRPRLPGRLYQWMIRRGISRAKTIVSVSQSTDLDVTRWVEGPSSHVVHNPLDDSFRVALEPLSGGGYALIVGTTGWRKRRELAISAWTQLRQANKIEIPLVIVGPPLTPSEHSILRVEGIDFEEIAVRTDLAEEELIRAYQGAQFLILASKYEGFAWPVLEANALGVPALCADEPILRETGAGNVFFDDSTTNDWKSIYVNLLQLHGSASLRGRALGFSTTNFSRRLKEVLDI